MQRGAQRTSRTVSVRCRYDVAYGVAYGVGVRPSYGAVRCRTVSYGVEYSRTVSHTVPRSRMSYGVVRCRTVSHIPVRCRVRCLDPVCRTVPYGVLRCRIFPYGVPYARTLPRSRLVFVARHLPWPSSQHARGRQQQPPCGVRSQHLTTTFQ